MNDPELDAAIAAAKRAAVIIEEWRKRFSVREKGRADLVTEADEIAQVVIRKELLGRFPDYGFFGEEGAKEKLDRDGPPTWIVDPIDGTTNYVHDLPLYCVSIGLMKSGELTHGVIYDPRHDELFAAAKGHGATLNGRTMSVSRTDTIGRALVTVGFASDLRGKEFQLDIWRHFSMISRGIRRTGSSALNLAYVAAGRFDAFWAFDLNPWDSAAGIVLVQEAGGNVSNISGGAFDALRPDVLASNGRIHAETHVTLNQMCH